MKVYSVEELVSEVRVALDMNEQDGALMSEGDTETLQLDSVIRGQLERGARFAVENAGVDKLGDGVSFGSVIGWPGTPGFGRGVIQLPADFLRLVTFQMSDWAYPVTTAITDMDPRYRMQFSKVAGVRGNPSRPVVALIHTTQGRALEFFSCATAGVELRRARYIPVPSISEYESDGGGRYGGIKLCPRLKDATVYYTAYLVALTLGMETAGTLGGVASALAGGAEAQG